MKLKSGQGYFSGADYEVSLSYPGYNESKSFIGTNIEGWYFGNILFGSFLGLLLIDPLTGAMWSLDTEQISVRLTPVE